jgi:hypothetical protein
MVNLLYFNSNTNVDKIDLPFLVLCRPSVLVSQGRILFTNVIEHFLNRYLYTVERLYCKRLCTLHM